MQLRSRAVQLAKPQAPIAVPPITADTARLASLEQSVATHRTLRGIMSFLFLVVYLLSSFQVDSLAGNVVIHVLILAISLCGEVCLVLVYTIKARYAGLTNPATTTTKQFSVMHSPYVSRMLLEMVVWIIQCPPGLQNREWGNALDSLILLRAYVVVQFFSQFTSREVFKRAIATLCGFRYDSGYFFRASFLLEYSLSLVIGGFVMVWLLLALLYCKVENTTYMDAAYFCMSSMATVGFGDFAPITFAGRFAAVLSWVVGLSFLAWCVGIMHELVKISEPERNLYNLFRANKECGVVPGEAARTIQRAWKLYCAKKEGRNTMSIQFNAVLLTNQVAAFRELRRRFADSEMAFVRSTQTFQDMMQAISPHPSTHATPVGTPRSASARRRPFALYQQVQTKDHTQRSPKATSTGGSPASSATTQPKTTPAVGRSVPSASAPVAGGGGSGGGVSGASVAELDRRMAQLERTLEGLIQKTQRITLNMNTEVDS